LNKRLKKEKKFKGDILKSVRELLLIKGQNVEGFNDLMELYKGTTRYETIIKLKEEIWKFTDKTPTGNWISDKLEKDLYSITTNEEGLKFFKTERFMNYIKEKSDAYTLIDFYIDIIGENRNLEEGLGQLLINRIKKN
jgi:dipeptidase